MKKTLAFLVLLSLLLCACSITSPSKPIAAPNVVTPPPATPSPSPAPEPVSPATPSPTPTPEPEPPATPEPVVIYDAFFETGNYSDSFNNTWNYVLRIPAIQASGTDATRLNQELFSTLYPDVKAAKDAMEENTSLGICRVDYTICINDQLISLVCETASVPENTLAREDGWRAFRVEGTLDFSLTGILSGLSAVLAENKIGIFAVSTYNTDYILVKEENFEKAAAALEAAGYLFSGQAR